MSDAPQSGGLIDRLVEWLAGTLDALGLNGGRLRWRWHRRKRELAEHKAQADVMLRSATTKHRMCPSCRALVPRSAGRCSECGEPLSGAARPGASRLLSQVFPGATAATSLILLANGFWFVMMLMAQLRAGEGAGLFRGFDIQLLYRFGAGWGRAVLAGEWSRLVTPIFLHGGVLHFGFNSWVLLQLGPMSQSEYGRDRFWVIYLLSGIAGNVAATLFSPNSAVVGASGAIFGLVGLLLALGRRKGGVAGRRLSSFMGQYAIFMFVISLLPGISLSAHAGGFVCGLLLGFVVPSGPLRNRSAAAAWEVAAIAGVLLVLYSFWHVARSLPS